MLTNYNGEVLKKHVSHFSSYALAEKLRIMEEEYAVSQAQGASLYRINQPIIVNGLIVVNPNNPCLEEFGFEQNINIDVNNKKGVVVDVGGITPSGYYYVIRFNDNQFGLEISEKQIKSDTSQ